jgi:hypothetical protein
VTGTTSRLQVIAARWCSDVWSRYRVWALAVLSLGLGLFVVLLVQPSPLTFAEGWSAPQAIGEVKWGRPHRVALDRRDGIHLVWHQQQGRRAVAYYARLDRHGRRIGEPIRLSDPALDSSDVAVAVLEGGAPLCFWVEKGHADGLQRLMMVRLDPGSAADVLTRTALASPARLCSTAWSLMRLESPILPSAASFVLARRTYWRAKRLSLPVSSPAAPNMSPSPGSSGTMPRPTARIGAPGRLTAGLRRLLASRPGRALGAPPSPS